MRVLLIEDDSAMARSIELMLRSEGLNVYTTDLGEEGIDLGKLYDYDIIVLDLQLPDMSGFIRTYFGIDPLTELVPIQPTAHYAMGGIPTDVDGRVLADETGRVVPGFFAAGECAWVSVHGANRLGTDWLLDLPV